MRPTTFTLRKRTVCGVAAVLAALGLQTSEAATYTYSGASGSTWNQTNTNWTGAPANAWDATNGPTNEAQFNGDTLTIGTGTVYAGAIRFITSANTINTGAGGVIVLGGSGGNSITNAVSNTQTINADLSITQDIPTIAGNITFNGDISAATAGTKTLSFIGAANNTLSGAITDGSGALAFTKTGTGSITLSGATANTFTGLTTVSAGTLNLGKTAAVNAIGGDLTINSGGDVAIVGVTPNADQIPDSATVTINGTGILSVRRNETIGGLTGDGTVRNNFTSPVTPQTLTIGGGDVSSSFSGKITDGGATLSITKTGAGTFTLSDSGNSYTGTTKVDGGTLSLTGFEVFTTANRAYVINNGGTLRVATARLVTAGAAGGTMTINDGGHLYLADNGFATSRVEVNSIDMTGGLVSSDPYTGAATGTASYNGVFTPAINIHANATPSTLSMERLSAAISGGNLTFTVDSGAQGDVTGVIRNPQSGATALVKTGSGTLTLSGNNTYTGATTVNQGTLTLSSTGSLNLISGLVVGTGTDGAAPVVNIEGTIAAASATAKPISIASAGVVNFSGTGTLTSSGVLAVGDAARGSFAAGNFNMLGGSLTVNGTGGLSVGEHSGATNVGIGQLRISGGTLTLGGSSPFRMEATTNGGTLTIEDSGTFVVNAGSTFQIANNPNGGAKGFVNLNTGGVLEIGRNITKGNGTATFNFDGGTLRALASSASFMTGLTTTNVKDGGALIDTNGFDITIGQSLLHFAGATTDSLTKHGAGTLTLSGANTYTGGTVLNAGTLTGDTNTAFGASGTTITLNAGSLVFASATPDADYTYNLNVVGSAAISQTNARHDLVGTITGGGTLDFVAGSMRMEVDMSGFTGTFKQNSTGELHLMIDNGAFGTAATTSGSASAQFEINSGSTYLLNNNQAGTAYLGALSGAGGVIYAKFSRSGDVTLEAGALGIDANYGGVIADGNTGPTHTSFTKVGNGTQTFSGALPNTYTGLTTISAGTLLLAKDTGVNAIAGDGNTGTNDILISGGALRWAADHQLGANINITLTNGVFDLAGHTETDIWSFTNTGGTFVTGVNGLLDGDGSTITWAGGSNTINSGATVMDPHWVISGGTNTVEGDATGTLHVEAGGAGLYFTGTASPTVTLNSGAASGGRILLENDVFVDAGLTSGTARILNGGALANPGFVDLGDPARTFDIHNGSDDVDMLISARLQNGGLQKQGTGTLRLTGDNTYNGSTSVEAGTLELAGGALQNGSITVNAGTFRQLNGTNNVTGANGNLTMAAGASYQLQGGTLNFGDYAAGGSTTWNPGDTSTVSMATGSQFSFTGGSLIDVSNIVVGDGSTFTQSGGDFFIGQDGAGPAAQTTMNGGFSLAAGALHFDAFGLDPTPDVCCDGVAGLNDQLTVLGDVTLDSVVTIDYVDFTPQFGDVFTLICADTITLGDGFALTGGYFRVVPTGNLTGPAYALQAIVPEPASVALWSLIGLVGAVMAWRRPNRRRATADSRQ